MSRVDQSSRRFVCGKEFLPEHGRKYCSPECREKAVHDQMVKANAKSVEAARRKKVDDRIEKRGLTVAECQLCHGCYYCSMDVGERKRQHRIWTQASCDYILIADERRGEPVSEHCSRYRPKEPGKRKRRVG